MIFIYLFSGDMDCTPPDASWCDDVEYSESYNIYHYYPCKSNTSKNYNVHSVQYIYLYTCCL